METVYETLQTLAKEEYTRRIKDLNITELDEILYKNTDYADLTYWGKCQFVAKKIFRPVMGYYTEDPQKWSAYIQKVCGDEWALEIAVDECNYDRAKQVTGEKNAKGELLAISFQASKTVRAVVYGFTGCTKYGHSVVAKADDTFALVDPASFFASLYMFREWKKETERIITLPKEEREQIPGYKNVKDRLLQMIRKDVDENFEEMMKYCDECRKEAEAARKVRVSKGVYDIHHMVARCFRHQEHARYWYYMFLLMMEGQIPVLEYADFINYSPENQAGWRMMDDFSMLRGVEDFLDPYVEARGKIVSNFSIYKDLGSDYARSFETKKNQSEKLKAEIKKSKLWKYFGYVEYDEDVDVEAIRQYEKEFLRFYEKHLKEVDLSQDAIRFRKLGQHHAAGMYYPTVKCLCVDIRNPWSMVHELGHLMDYQLGNLSAQPAFEQIYNDTREYLLKRSEAGDALAKQLKGKTKYNLQYFQTPTEVFARSFELYATFILKEKSSILQQSYDAVYNTSDENLKHIKEYFERIFDYAKV